MSASIAYGTIYRTRIQIRILDRLCDGRVESLSAAQVH